MPGGDNPSLSLGNKHDCLKPLRVISPVLPLTGLARPCDSADEPCWSFLEGHLPKGATLMRRNCLPDFACVVSGPEGWSCCSHHGLNGKREEDFRETWLNWATEWANSGASLHLDVLIGDLILPLRQFWMSSQKPPPRQSERWGQKKAYHKGLERWAHPSFLSDDQRLCHSPAIFQFRDSILCSLVRMENRPTWKISVASYESVCWLRARVWVISVSDCYCFPPLDFQDLKDLEPCVLLQWNVYWIPNPRLKVYYMEHTKCLLMFFIWFFSDCSIIILIGIANMFMKETKKQRLSLLSRVEDCKMCRDPCLIQVTKQVANKDYWILVTHHIQGVPNLGRI
jgi:hypothetical protein